MISFDKIVKPFCDLTQRKPYLSFVLTVPWPCQWIRCF